MDKFIKVKAINPCIMKDTGKPALIVGKIYGAMVYEGDINTISLTSEVSIGHMFDHPDHVDLRFEDNYFEVVEG